MKIVVLDGYALNPGDLSWDKLSVLGDLAVYERTSREQILERAKDAACVLTNKTVLDAETLSALPALRYIGVLATGYNVVDTAAASARGIVVANIPAYSTASVAQMVFAHLLTIVQRVNITPNRPEMVYGAANRTFVTGILRFGSYVASRWGL